MAFTPDGTKAYVANYEQRHGDADHGRDEHAGHPDHGRRSPRSRSRSAPDGTKAYVTNQRRGTVTPITVATNTPGTPITVGEEPRGLAVTPDGKTASDAGSHSWELEGLAATYNQAYPVSDFHGNYRETIAPGSFSDAVTGKEIVSLGVQHNRSAAPLASTGRSGTMTLTDSAAGLVLRATLPKNDPDVVAAVSKVERGLLDRLSIGFRAVSDAWSQDRTQRTIRAAALSEVSLVHQPANPGAVVTAVRAEDTPDGLEVRLSPSGIAIVETRRDFTDQGEGRAREGG